MSHVSDDGRTGGGSTLIGALILAAGAGGFMFWVLSDKIDSVASQVSQSESRITERFTTDLDRATSNLEDSIEAIAGRVDALEQNPDPLGIVAIQLYRQRLLQLMDGMPLDVPDSGGGSRQYPEAVEWFKFAFAQQTSVTSEVADQHVEAALLNPMTREGSAVLSVLERIERLSDDPAIRRNVQMVASELYLALPDAEPASVPPPAQTRSQ